MEFIDGVTLLNEYAHYDAWGWGYIVLGLIWLVVTILYLNLYNLGDNSGFRKAAIIIAGLCVVTNGIIGILRLITPDYTCYEVTIDDNVRMADFDERYEVVEKKGEIYCIRLRDIKRGLGATCINILERNDKFRSFLIFTETQKTLGVGNRIQNLKNFGCGNVRGKSLFQKVN